MESLKQNEMDASWYYFTDKYPEPYSNIKVDLGGEIIETSTYLHQQKLMVEFSDGNDYFQGVSPKLFSPEAKWCYKS